MACFKNGADTDCDHERDIKIITQRPGNIASNENKKMKYAPTKYNWRHRAPSICCALSEDVNAIAIITAYANALIPSTATFSSLKNGFENNTLREPNRPKW